MIDENHNLLKIIKQNLVPGDINAIAQKLKLSQTTVSKVLHGKGTSKRILDALIKQAEENKRVKEKSFAYLLKSMPGR